LILHVHVGKRDNETASEFLAGLKRAVNGRIQITSDGFKGYTSPTEGVRAVFGEQVDYATEIKTYGPLHPAGFGRRDNPVVCQSVKRKARIGTPNMKLATVNHAERQNLNVRLFNRRFTRKTLGYSKKLANHRWSMIIQAAHFNFCRVHSTIEMTPAQAAGLTDHAWMALELISFAV
jgi:IS1 family transposase